MSVASFEIHNLTEREAHLCRILVRKMRGEPVDERSRCTPVDVGFGGWSTSVSNLICVNGNWEYRIPPKRLEIPWDVIKPEFKWAAMDSDGCVCFYKSKPELLDTCWNANRSDVEYALVLNIDTDGIDWRESLVQRPEGDE